LITRNREEEENRWTLGKEGSIVQTNIDHWSSNEGDDILYSIERRALARNLLDSLEDVKEEVLWDILSNFPILNSLTVSGTYMRSADGMLRTVIPHPYKDSHDSPGFRGLDYSISVVRSTCQACRFACVRGLNVEGDCGHIGEWHSTFGDCSYLKCGLGLKTSIGKRHWSCCFSTEKDSLCPKSPAHVLE